MNRIAQEAHSRQAVVKLAMKKGKSGIALFLLLSILRNLFAHFEKAVDEFLPIYYNYGKFLKLRGGKER